LEAIGFLGGNGAGFTEAVDEIEERAGALAEVCGLCVPVAKKSVGKRRRPPRYFVSRPTGLQVSPRPFEVLTLDVVPR
jgi:hypothetical protein